MYYFNFPVMNAVQLIDLACTCCICLRLACIKVLKILTKTIHVLIWHECSTVKNSNIFNGLSIVSRERMAGFLVSTAL